MFVSEAANAAAKKAQLARLALKGTPEYPAMYAKQPEQIRIAAEQQAARKVRRDAKEALQAGALSDAAGALAVFGGGVDLTAGKAKGKG